MWPRLAIGHQRQGLDKLYDFAELWELRRDAFAKVSDHAAVLISRPPETGKVVPNARPSGSGACRGLRARHGRQTTVGALLGSFSSSGSSDGYPGLESSRAAFTTETRWNCRLAAPGYQRTRRQPGPARSRTRSGWCGW